jgi:hypothetical protein
VVKCVTSCTGRASPINDYSVSPPACGTSCAAPKFSYAVGGNSFCYLQCPENLWSNTVTNGCQVTCTGAKAQVLNGLKTCVATCDASYPVVDATVTPNLCMAFCPNNTVYNVNAAAEKQCLASCPAANSTLGLVGNAYAVMECLSACAMPLLSYTLNSKTYCASSCPASLNYQNVAAGTCVSQCPVNTVIYVNNRGDTLCLAACPKEQPYKDSTVAQPTCATKCSPTSFIDGLECVVSCAAPKFADQTNTPGDCLAACRNGYASVTISGINYCVSNCSGNLPYLNTVPTPKVCVATCPANTFIYSSLLAGRLCVTTCPYL